jgi:hypothetical protein
MVLNEITVMMVGFSSGDGKPLQVWWNRLVRIVNKHLYANRMDLVNQIKGSGR